MWCNLLQFNVLTMSDHQSHPTDSVYCMWSQFMPLQFSRPKSGWICKNCNPMRPYSLMLGSVLVRDQAFRQHHQIANALVFKFWCSCRLVLLVLLHQFAVVPTLTKLYQVRTSIRFLSESTNSSCLQSCILQCLPDTAFSRICQCSCRPTSVKQL